jgi:phospholipase/lecithinase/hemolysin
MSSTSSENIWESLLRESLKSTANVKNIGSSSLIFLGDSNSDQNYKSQVLSLLSSVKKGANTANQSDRVVNGINIVSSGVNIVEYEYFSTDDGNVVNLWSFDSNIRGIDCKPADLDIIYSNFPNDQVC